MLDRASIERLSRAPERNAPILNVALAEEGTSEVLLTLARCAAVGPEALAAIEERVARDGPEVGRDLDGKGDAFTPVDDALDRLLVVHASASDATRDAVLARHGDDAFFVLAAACHPRATLGAIERAIDWPSASPAHDRLWITLLDPSAAPPLAIEEWSQDASPLRRDAAARLARDEAVLARLAHDPARQVRRGVASNRGYAGRAALASDGAVEVRARASAPLPPHEPAGSGAGFAESARFAAAFRVMASGGLVSPDVVRALSSSPAELDAEGAELAGRVLPRREVVQLIDAVAASSIDDAVKLGLAAGLALRPPVPRGARAEDHALEEGEHTELVYDAVKALSQATTRDGGLTGKARLASWAAEGFGARGANDDAATLLAELARRPLAAERVILGRVAAKVPALVGELSACAAPIDGVPAALLELAWSDARVPEDEIVALASRIAAPKKRAEDVPEDEVDLDPSARSIELLERVVLVVTQRANVSPRGALSVVALDARRVRYILAALPSWKGRITGGRLARVLRQHGAAISVAQAESRARASKIEAWTERLMSEIEAGVALAVGHLTGAEVARRITIGRQAVDDGLSIAAGAEARAAVEGPASVAPLLAWGAQHRTTNAAALAVWLLLERLDRERQRAPTLVATSIDALASSRAAMPTSVIDALATLEHRRPGRLEAVHAQSPRGRATLASAIARAYRAIGGMRDERQG
jgi:hypothetical protein